MVFKSDLIKGDFYRLHPRIYEILGGMAHTMASQFGHELCVTSMLRPQVGDSGVHATGRAVDVSRHMYTGSGRRVLSTLGDEDIEVVVRGVNAAYPRSDGRSTLLYHAVPGGESHFHLQVPYDAYWERHERANMKVSEKRL